MRNIEGAFRVCADAGDVHLQINKLSAHPGTGEGHRRCAAEASAGSLTALVDAQVIRRPRGALLCSIACLACRAGGL